MAYNKMGARGIALPPFEQTDLGWLATMPSAGGTFLGQPLDILIEAFEEDATKPDPAVLRFFTERRLRPLTMIPDGEAQMAQFAELLADARELSGHPEQTTVR